MNLSFSLKYRHIDDVAKSFVMTSTSFFANTIMEDEE
jgi:hypothetical protein